MRLRPFSQACTRALAAATMLVLAAGPAHAQTYTVIHSFGSGTDGSTPVGNIAAHGSVGHGFSGATQYGGVYGYGTVFSLTEEPPSTWTETVVHSFVGSDGSYPLVGQSGAYGTTFSGGDYGKGTLYRYSLDFTANVYSFCAEPGCAGGSAPEGIVLPSGSVYGVSELGGALGYGTVFEWDPSTGAETVLHSLAGGGDGEYPVGAVAGTGTSLYYTASKAGGTCDCGGVYELDVSSGAVTILHLFEGDPDGQGVAGVALIGGNLLGVTPQGGTHDAGMVFEVTAAGDYEVLYSFTGGADGCYPSGTLAADSAGNLYGTALACGSSSAGTLWELGTGGVFTVLHTFCTVSGCPDGEQPTGLSRPVASDPPVFYGTATTGGAYGGGVAFQFAQ
jgi:uncharacterized repeat protein (TIGR03803 family)